MAFGGHHIQQFNQRCRNLTSEGKVIFTHKECRDLQAEILELFNALRAAESQILELNQKIANADNLSIELNGGNF